MEKPITLKREELIAKVAQAVNESEVPAFVVADVFRRLADEAAAAHEQQVARDAQAWQQAVEAWEGKQAEEQEEQGEDQGEE